MKKQEVRGTRLPHEYDPSVNRWENKKIGPKYRRDRRLLRRERQKQIKNEHKKIIVLFDYPRRAISL